jgi:SRSO17 transposase
MIRAWIIDDTAFPKKGTHSAGVARQYRGQLGRRTIASLPIVYRLYLPEAWADTPD